MRSVNYRTPSLLVGWLNIILSVLVAIYYIYQLSTYEEKLVTSAESVESDENVQNYDSESIYASGVIQNFMLFLAFTVFLWFVPSILLVKGIKQNCHQLVAPWLYISYVSVAINSVFFLSMCWFMISYSGSFVVGVYSCLPFSFGLVFTILCLYPVRRLYKIMSIPPLILPTQWHTLETKQPEDHLRYMPVFDNC